MRNEETESPQASCESGYGWLELAFWAGGELQPQEAQEGAYGQLRGGGGCCC